MMNRSHQLSTHRPMSIRITLRFAVPMLAAAALLGLPTGSHLRAQTTAQADSQEASSIDPAAMDALNKMGTYLRSLKSFQVSSDITSDDVTNDGQVIQSDTKINLLAVRPDRLRFERIGANEHQFLFFDGKNFTIYGQLVNYYATVPAPATISELIDNLSNKYGIELPLVDLFYWGTNDAVIKRIKGAIDIGPSTIDGTTCEQYAFHQQDIDWQIWIQLGDFPLPRKLVIRTLTDPARPQHSQTLSWNLAPSFSENAFTFDPPAGAQSIPMEEIKDTSGTTGK
jgi:hypothetical protein